MHCVSNVFCVYQCTFLKCVMLSVFFFSSRRRHTRCSRDWSSDVCSSEALLDQPGGIFIRRSDSMTEEERMLLHAVARVVIVSERGSLEDQLVRRPIEGILPAPFQPRVASQIYPETALDLPKLSFFNGLGGFAHGGRQYVIVLGEGQWAPAPWSNVIANSADFGFLITENGGGFTWSTNSHENRLTPWSNDAVSDPPSEVIYLRDEDSGAIWTPTPLPIRVPQR